MVRNAIINANKALQQMPKQEIKTPEKGLLSRTSGKPNQKIANDSIRLLKMVKEQING